VVASIDEVPMSPRTLAISILILSTGVLLAAVMLAMPSPDTERSLLEAQPESAFTAETLDHPATGSCAETAPQQEVAGAWPDTAWITRC